MHILKYAALAAMVVAGSANAELVETDWLTDGDGLATLDTTTGLEWLDLTVTDSLSINEVSLELGEGGDYEGWRLPTAEEVEALIISYFGITDYSEDVDTYTVDNSDELVDEWQYYFGESGADGRSMGRYENTSGDGSLAGTRDSGTIFISYGTDDFDEAYRYYGVFLVSDGGTTLSSVLDPSINTPTNVPAPVGLTLVGALLGFGAFRGRRGNHLQPA
ncbi:hypothetical protein [Alteromonas sp. 14N.309.X.WAT.G.H12]|uniref:hypothetical protein n=1 Tax=Alteromonas sp. 14N.309.X.WAT.G.H12 TaxID=3120824 RepID=UPI002FD77872